jgi:hypothetical protein
MKFKFKVITIELSKEEKDNLIYFILGFAIGCSVCINLIIGKVI